MLEDGTSDGVFGVKIMWQHVGQILGALQAERDGPPRDLRRLEEVLPNLRFVHVTRSDVVRQAVSWAKAILTGSWDSGQSGHAVPSFDRELVTWCHRTLLGYEKAWGLAFQSAGIEPHRVTYERLIDSYEATVQELLAFLALPPADASRFRARKLRRQSDATNDAWVERFRREVEQAPAADVHPLRYTSDRP